MLISPKIKAKNQRYTNITIQLTINNPLRTYLINNY